METSFKKIDMDSPDLINWDGFFKENHEWLKVDVIKKHFREKMIELLMRQNYKDTDYYFITPVTQMTDNNFHYFYFESRFDGCTPSMKRYHMGAVSLIFLEIYWTDSNIIGMSHTYTLDEVKARFRGHLTGLLNMVNE